MPFGHKQAKDRLKEALEMGTKQGMPTGPVTLRKAMDSYLLDAKSRSSTQTASPPPVDTPVPTLRLGDMQNTFSEADSQLAELQMKLAQLKSARDGLPFMSTSNLSDFAMTRSFNMPSDDPSGDQGSFSLR